MVSILHGTFGTANVEKAEIIPLQNDPSAYGSIRFYWKSRETGESKVRSYAFSQYRIAKAVDFALEFPRIYFTGKMWTHPELNNAHSEDFNEYKFWQRKELK